MDNQPDDDEPTLVNVRVESYLPPDVYVDVLRDAVNEATRHLVWYSLAVGTLAGFILWGAL